MIIFNMAPTGNQLPFHRISAPSHKPVIGALDQPLPAQKQKAAPTVDDINPASPIMRNIP